MSASARTFETYLTVNEAAAIAKLRPFRIRQLIKAGLLEGVRPGGVCSWRIKSSSLKRFMETPVDRNG